jgi:PAC2 family
MVQARDLFTIHDVDTEVTLGLHMIGGLSGFTDAGSTVSQFAQQIFANLEHKLLISFNNDELLDYRSRRPVMYFEKDHIESYEPAVLGIYLVWDEARQPFLYLHGYEPDFRWEAFSEAMAFILDFYAVSDFTWVHAIPFPIPHTRAVGVTVSGNRKDLIEQTSEWRPQTQVPGNVLHLLEYRFAADEIPTAGFVLLVPHYLSESDYPQSAVAAFEQVTSATGLVFPTDDLRDDGVRFLAKLEGQVAENEELARMIANLEQGFLNNPAGPNQAPMRKPQSKIPNADEIAAELEDYLASRRKNSAEDSTE